MAVILDEVPAGEAADNIYDRVQKARQDALLLIDQDAEYMQVNCFRIFLILNLCLFFFFLFLDGRSGWKCHPLATTGTS